MANYISGNDKRIFINPTLGCDSSCAYCYLGSQGLVVGKKTDKPQSAESLIKALLAFPEFREGSAGSIISIGCYSECWSASNASVTIEFIKKALLFANPIQFATKRRVRVGQLVDVFPLVQWSGQLSLFVSCSTISQWRVYEKGTSRPEDRFRELVGLISNGLKVCIYIKPVLDGVTINDLDLFSSVIEGSGCSVVVGEVFDYRPLASDVASVKAPIPSDGLYIGASKDLEKILSYFNAKGYVCYTSSIDAIDYWRST